MWTWIVRAVVGFFSFSKALFGFLGERRLRKAGKDEQRAEDLEETVDRVERANRAARDPERLRDVRERFTRD